MSWSTLRTKVDSLMTAIGYTKATETFDIESVPESVADDSYCVVLNEINQNESLGFNYASMYPIASVNINVIFRLGLNSQSRYDDAVANVEEIIQTILAPDNRSVDIRIVNYAGTKFTMYDDGGFWMIAENSFTMQYELNYNSLGIETGEGLKTQ